jgi:hypothetical protein
VPELRIVDDELWQRVKLRQAELAKQFEATIKGVRAARAESLNRLRRAASLLSGLLTCGCCGGKYGIVVNDRYAPLARWPEDGPSLTAAVLDGTGRAQVGAEGWCRSNKRMGLPDAASRTLYRVREAEVPDSCATITVMKNISFRPS